MNKLISLVVPCYNEEQVIRKFHSVCNEIIKTVPNYKFEYLMVNDGSKDDTLAILKSLAKEDVKVKYISLSRNFGKEAAILAGLKNALGDYVVLMDADLQHPPKLIIDMIYHIEQGYDSVAAKRTSRNGESFLRSYFSNLFYKVINKISDIDITKGATDYRIMSRKMINSVLEITEYHRFSKGIFEWVGYDTKWIEYVSEDREAGESKWSFISLFKYAIEGIVSFSTTPLKIASFLGGVAALGGFIYLAYIIIKTLVLGIDVPGYASMMSLIMFFAGVQLIAIGIIGEYLARTYMESKSRPVFFIKEHNINEE